MQKRNERVGRKSVLLRTVQKMELKRKQTNTKRKEGGGGRGKEVTDVEKWLYW